MNKTELEKMLREQLARHDWWYMMSDDNRYYEAGRRSSEAISKTKALLLALGKSQESINEIHNEYAPEEKKI